MGVYGNWIRIANQDNYNINYIAERKYGDMKKLRKKLWEKKDSKMGFTLVELIVVLVILAILAAIMIPSLIGWIDKAREKQIVLEARNSYLAAQELVFEKYAADKDVTTDALKNITNVDIQEISKDNNEEKNPIKDVSSTDDGCMITSYTYKANGFTATYNGTTWDISKD